MTKRRCTCPQSDPKWQQRSLWVQEMLLCLFGVILCLFLSGCLATTTTTSVCRRGGALLHACAQGPIVAQSVHACASIHACTVCALQVEYIEALEIYESQSINTEGQMSLAGFLRWNSVPETLRGRPVWQSLPSLSPPSAGTKRHLSYVHGEEKSQHFVWRTPRSGFTKFLTGGAARCFYA